MDVGVIIGRFQVDKLHEGHLFLINAAIKNHRKVIVFIGATPHSPINDPLDYPTRERMIRAEFPEVYVMPLTDKASDQDWSNQIDEYINVHFPGAAAVLYGGRDSFVPHYFGKHKAVEVDSGISYMSGTQLRSDIGKVVRSSSDFRAGIIYHSQNIAPPPVSSPAVIPATQEKCNDNRNSSQDTCDLFKGHGGKHYSTFGVTWWSMELEENK